MRHGKDDRTLDIFAVPQPVQAMPGHGNYSVQVSELVAELMKHSGLDRPEIAARMTHLSGGDVSSPAPGGRQSGTHKPNRRAAT